MKALYVAVALAILATPGWAATVYPESFLTVPIDGGWVGGSGNVGEDGFDDWALELSPDGQDAQVTSIAVEFSFHSGALEIFSREEGSTDSDGWLSQGAVGTTGWGGLQVASLTFMALDAFDYVLRISGHAGRIGAGYIFGVAAVSPVPIPAAAWLFVSALAGGIFMSRRNGKAENGL
jgi:hypothetical protein